MVSKPHAAAAIVSLKPGIPPQPAEFNSSTRSEYPAAVALAIEATNDAAKPAELVSESKDAIGGAG
jgi:hypothetical protein